VTAATASSAAYIVAALLFILSLAGLSRHESAKNGNLFGIAGMVIALAATIGLATRSATALGSTLLVVAMVVGAGIGLWRARVVEMTGMPELIAVLHSFVGLAAVLVGWNGYLSVEREGAAQTEVPADLLGIHSGAVVIGVFISAVTFTGSVIAFLKLSARMSGAPILLPLRHVINIALAIAIVVITVWFVRAESHLAFWLLVLTAFMFGVLIIVPIGGADMPVVISMLNSYSGWAAAGIGFTLGNSALIITGALVGSSGAILSYIMCKGMNRSFISVILGGFGGEVAGPAAGGEQRPVKIGSAEDAAFILKNAGKVIIVPGYGMAVAQAQHALREMADILKAQGVEVKYAIHPVAGRMPGHMNVLLAEADVPYDRLFEMDDINPDFPRADVALVIGANDVVNPAARNVKDSPIAGMPILNAHEAHTVMVIKRSMSPGFAGIDNELYYMEKTLMLFGDAKSFVASIVKELNAAVPAR